MNGDIGRLLLFIVVPALIQKSMHRPDFSQSPYRVGSRPFGPPISFGGFGEVDLPDLGPGLGGSFCAFFVIASFQSVALLQLNQQECVPRPPSLLFYQESCEMRALLMHRPTQVIIYAAS